MEVQKNANQTDGNIASDVHQKIKTDHLPRENDIVIANDADGAVIRQLVYTKIGKPNSDGTPRKAKPHLASTNPDYPDHAPCGADTPIRGIVVDKLPVGICNA